MPMNSIRFVSACLLAACLPAGNVPAAEGIEILPARVSLSTTVARQRIIVQEVADGKYGGQRGKDVELTSSDPAIARIEEGLVIPVKNGTATITASLDGQQATAEVTVSGQKEPFEWSFRNHVESVLSKSGCNSGACHSAKAGQNGFPLQRHIEDTFPRSDFFWFHEVKLNLVGSIFLHRNCHALDPFQS